MSNKPNKQTRKIYLHAKKETWETEYSLYLATSDLTSVGWILLETREISVTMPPPQELDLRMIEALQARKKSIQVNTEIELQSIDDHIQSLQQLTHKEDPQ